MPVTPLPGNTKRLRAGGFKPVIVKPLSPLAERPGFSHTEKAAAGTVEGNYQVSDGGKEQRVDYKVRGDSGFVAKSAWNFVGATPSPKRKPLVRGLTPRPSRFQHFRPKREKTAFKPKVSKDGTTVKETFSATNIPLTADSGEDSDQNKKSSSRDEPKSHRAKKQLFATTRFPRKSVFSRATPVPQRAAS